MRGENFVKRIAICGADDRSSFAQMIFAKPRESRDGVTDVTISSHAANGKEVRS